MRIRGADTIVAQGKRHIAGNPAFYASLEAAYGVPAAVIVAIHGMETGFGNFMGDANVLSAISTLAYDCRRSDFFSGHAMAALQLVDRGSLSANTVGAMHGEVGHTQFLPGNVMRYGVDGDGNGTVDLTQLTDSLASTANFLRQKRLAFGCWVSARAAELRRDPRMERRWRLPKSHRNYGRQNRRLIRPVCF